MRRLSLWFLGTTILGIAVSVIPSRIYVSTVQESIAGTVTPTDYEKEYVEQFSDRIKWLETIAYAALAGIVGLRWSQEKLVAHPAVAASAGCLVVSLFNGYMLHDQVLQALQTHTPMLLAGVVSRMTSIWQFWFLAIAVALLALRLLSVPRTGHRAMFCIFAIIVGCMAASTSASAQDGNVQACSSEWVKTRFNRTATQDELALLTQLVSGTANAKKVQLDAQNRCTFSDSVLDFVLNGSYMIYGDREYDHFLAEARVVSQGVNNPGAGERPIVRTLLTVAEIWHNARGVLHVASSQIGDEVYIDNRQVGLTPFTCAIASGEYDLRVSRKGTVIDNEKIEVHDGVQLERKIN